MAPTKLGVPAGKSVSVEDAIKALVTLSANDVAAAIGENIAGSESAFADRMTKTARSLGMSRTTFKNASGLPNPGQITTARDMATLSLRIQRDFPQYYPYFKMMSFNYKGRVIRTHNRLLGKFDGTDGIKTGYIRASGFNLTSSVKRGDKRIIGVVMGGKSGNSRNQYMISMLSKHLPKCKDGKMLAASIKGAPAPKEIELAAVEETQAVAVDQIIEPETPPAVEAAVTTKKTKPSAEQGPALRQDGCRSRARRGRSRRRRCRGCLEPGRTDRRNSAHDPGRHEGRLAGRRCRARFWSRHCPRAARRWSPSSQWRSTALRGQGRYRRLGLGWTNPGAAVRDELEDPDRRFPEQARRPGQIARCPQDWVSLLSDKQAFTVQVQKGTETIYRARFSGFSEDAARAACRQLTQKGIGCVALSPQS